MKKLLLILLYLPLIGFGQTNINMVENANQSYRNSDAQLNEVYREILKEYSSDTIFIKALRISQRNWIKFRDSELKMKYPDRGSSVWYGSIYPLCVSNYLAELTQIRTERLKIWLTGIEEGDVCSGTVKNKNVMNDVDMNDDEIVENDVVIEDELIMEDTESDEDVMVEFEEEESDDEFFMVVEDMPTFPGGNLGLMKFIQKNVKYPPIAEEYNITGKVYISYIVDKSGAVTNVKVVRGVDKNLDAEAVRVVKSLPKYKPGYQRGKPVRVMFTIPINFTKN